MSNSLEREARRQRIILSQSQKDTLCAWFEKNPYPDLAARESMAREMGISESQILTWFQKHRRLKQREFECFFRKNQPQGQAKAQFKTQVQGGGKDPRELTDLATLPLRVSPQPLPGNQPLQHQDEYFFLHFWDEWFQSFIAEWEPEKGYYWSPGQSEVQEIQDQGQSPENSSQLSQEAQQHQV
ncbi:PREDICTED: cone-rod homeobox protein-like [Dipodomys ordii]|uniref:Cone-rod homeobox protein-like n=1 Tax=Dipodomys ordii TaxID=10020 RepID=A0A1S3GFC9_DIPOR|nr:PREDICTED: cone-rod homeobox protein-like [Dipodomys ordii]